MQSVLFHDTIFGPIHSRRLGTSLGVNLMPNDGKICTFDCLYCEAGYNAQGAGTTGLPSRQDVAKLLEEKLSSMSQVGDALDVITFSGNGEPTVHPQFPEIIDDVIALRDKYYPQAKVSVLTNSTMAYKPSVAEALKRVDNNILKLDSAIEDTMLMLDRPNRPGFSVEGVIDDLKQFAGTGIIQTMITRGYHDGKRVDNSTPEEIDALIAAYKQLQPREIMIYSIDRRTPEQSLEQVSKAELSAIAARIEQETSIPVQVA